MDRIKGFFTQKFWILPVWGWAGIILALVLGYMYWKKIGIFAAATTPTAATTGSGGTPSALDSGSGAGGAGGGLGDVAPALYTPVSGNGAAAALTPSAPISDMSQTSYTPTSGSGAPPATPDPVAAIAAVVSNFTSSPLYRQPVYPVEAAGTSYAPSVQPIVAFNPVRGRSSGNQAIG